jgi:hypothetical protein
VRIRADLDSEHEVAMPGVHLERHVFGSQCGYTTLAHSPGLSQADCCELERLSFGTPYDPAYRAGLTRNVAYWSRPLAGGRRAVTRVLPGDPDDEGRPTLLLVTVVLTGNDWDGLLEGDVRPLLRRPDVWGWNRSTQIAGIDLNDLVPGSLGLSGASAQRVLGLISLVELSWLTQRPVVVREEHYTWNEVAAVERLLPRDARRGYSAVYRSLNPDLPASLNCLARGLPVGSIAVSSLDQAKSPYAMQLARAGLGSVREDLALGYVGFGRPRVEMAQELVEGAMLEAVHVTGRPARNTQRAHTAAWAVAVLSALLVGGVGGWFAHRATLRPAPQVTLSTPARWEALLTKAIQLPAAAPDKQAALLGELQTALRGPEFAAEPDSAQIAEACINTLHAIDLIRSAEQRLEGIPTQGAKSIDAAENAVKMLDDPLPEVAVRYHHWLEAQRQALRDPIADFAGRLREAVKGKRDEIGSSRDQPFAAERKARELRGALQLVQSAQSHEAMQWITAELEHLDQDIQSLQATTAGISRQDEETKKAEQSKSEDAKRQAIAQIQEISVAISGLMKQENQDAAFRKTLAAKLRLLAQSGGSQVGSQFRDGLEQVANWIEQLRVATPLSTKKELEVLVRETRMLHDDLQKLDKELERRPGLRDTDLADLRGFGEKVRQLADKLAELERLYAAQ